MPYQWEDSRLVSLVVILVTVLIGSIAQRVTGMGFAIVAAPFIILSAGGVYGVVVINICAAFISAVMIIRLWPNIEWPKFRFLFAGAACGVMPGLWVISNMPTAWLELAIGPIVAAALLAGRVMQFRHPANATRSRTLYAGVAGGFMNTAAGLGGPAISVYAFATNWQHEKFAATMQPYFLFLSPITLSALIAVSDHAELPSLQIIASLFLVCGVGLFMGELVSTRIPAVVASRTLLTLAFVGAFATTLRGVVNL